MKRIIATSAAALVVLTGAASAMTAASAYESTIKQFAPEADLSGYSDAAIAQDLRREVHRMIMAGKSDTEITQYMVQRYGEFVLYRPRVNAATAVLWYGPFVLVLIGGVVWWRLSARRNAPVAKETDLTPAEQARLAALMEESDSDHGGRKGD